MTEERDVELSAIDELFCEAWLAQRGHDRLDGLLELCARADDAAVRNPDRSVLARWFDDQREGKVTDVVGRREHPARRRRNPRSLEAKLHLVFSEREAQDLGRGAGERDTQQLQQQGHGAFEPGIARERFAEVECTVGVELRESRAQVCEVAIYRHELGLVPGIRQSLGNTAGHESHLGTRGPAPVDFGR